MQRWTVPVEPLNAAFRCRRLSCTLSVRACLLRQEGARRGRTKQKNRGQGSLYPSCFGCPQGARLAASTPGADRLKWRAAGRGWLARFERGREGRRREAQELARDGSASGSSMVVLRHPDSQPARGVNGADQKRTMKRTTEPRNTKPATAKPLQ